ncbi:UNKNOWN [Stylonychia lemnae]|uniref:Uncharacterized protein n=1 Tax=Stylonychia lemnae TaxID=5949 RepID=A0A077ZZ37_STYLE|nr:UNKNOWN [Stylonychia lemnae]|eukprot:CDW75216.1 UNKNOWN [Stylonychia lemnae]
METQLLQTELCCQLFAKVDDKRYLIPLKNQIVNARVMNSIATIEIIQTCFNDSSDPLEVFLNVPVEEDYGIGKLIVQIDENIIEGKILEKKKAKERYDDAIAAGHTAALAQEEEEKEEIKLIIGNLLPGQKVQVHLQLLNTLKMEAGAYCLRVPIHYFPAFISQSYEYTYQFNLDIQSISPITYLSYPSQSKIDSTYSDEKLHRVQISKEGQSILNLEDELVYYFRTNDMEQTVLYSQELDSHPDEIALMLSFVPSFIEKTATDTNSNAQLQVVEDEMPDPQSVQSISIGACMYIFIVDQSGSMSGDKNTITCQALILFLKSLPPGSQFEIIPFGSDFRTLSGNPEGFQYNDQTLNQVINQVNRFQAEMGGTSLYEPLHHAINNIKTTLNKRIFMLTDGEVHNRQAVLDLAASCPFDVRIHTIGVGLDCDVKLVRKCAILGRGSFSMAAQNKDLKSMVITALTRAKDPTYSNCKFNFNHTPIVETNTLKYKLRSKNSYELYSNEVFMLCILIPKKFFQSFTLKLTSDVHPIQNKVLNQEWDQKHFSPIEKGDELFKIAARMKINQISQDILSSKSNYFQSIKEKQIEELSLKYQVLSKMTSFLAVSKNDDQPLGELKATILNKIEKLPNQDLDRFHYDISFTCCAINQDEGAECDDDSWQQFSYDPPDIDCKLEMNQNYYEVEQEYCNKYEAKNELDKAEAVCLGKAVLECDNEIIGAMSNEKHEESKQYLQQEDKIQSPRHILIADTSYNIITKQDLPNRSITLDELIIDQSSSGYWRSIDLIQSFIKEDIKSDQVFIQEIMDAISDKSAFEQILLTLVALMILAKKFGKKKSEWQLIAQKARDFVKAQGIQKPDNLVKKISYSIL